MNFKKLFFNTVFIIYATALSAQIVDNDFKNNQPKDNSPLSRIGLGNITPQYLASNGALGGISAAYRDPYSVNPFNPASLASLRTASFEIGLNAKRNTVSDGTNSSKAWSGNLNYMALGFPTHSIINEILDRQQRKVRWGMGLSLMPYNSVSYSVSTSQKAPGIDTLTINNLYFGSGGTYRLMLGNGISYKGLSAGANIGYIFGKMNYIRQSEYLNVLIPYDNYFDDYYTLKAFYWNVGLQYDITLDPVKVSTEKGNRKHIVIGLYGNPALDFKTSQSFFHRRVVNGTIIQDTLAFGRDLDGTGVLPTELTAGISYENGLNYKFGIEYRLSKWSQYKNDARPNDVLKDASELSLGAEFILNKSKLKSEEEKVRWRLGYRTGKDPRVLDNVQLSTWSASAGMCLPMRVGRGQQISYLNLNFEYGNQGTAKLSEKFVRLTVGFSLNDNSWFLKRKFQ